MNYKQTVAILLTAMFAFSFVAVTADDSSATVTFDSADISYSGFTDMDNGTVKFTVKNNDSIASEITVKAVQKNSSSVYAEKVVTVPAYEENFEVSLSFGLGSQGVHDVEIQIFENGIMTDCQTININVSHSIWKDASTYVGFIVVIVVIIALAYVYMRNSPKRAAIAEKKGAKTFTEMEAEKKAKKSAEVAQREEYKSEGRKSRRKQE